MTLVNRHFIPCKIFKKNIPTYGQIVSMLLRGTELEQVLQLSTPCLRYTQRLNREVNLRSAHTDKKNPLFSQLTPQPIKYFLSYKIERSADLTFLWGFVRSCSSDLRERTKGSNFNQIGPSYETAKTEAPYHNRSISLLKGRMRQAKV